MSCSFGANTLSHSHIPIEHLLKQIETYTAKRCKQGLRPAWLTDFINKVAEILEPISGVARAGFDCQLGEDAWVVGMYLGCIEQVGGRNDGRTRYINFELNLQELLDHFSQVDEFFFSAFPMPDEEAPDLAKSFITITGMVEEHPLRLQVSSVPPEDSGIGMRQHADGRCETV